MRRLSIVLTMCSKVSSVIAGGLLLFLAGVLVADVVGRNLFNSPLPGTVAVVETALVGLVFLGLAWGQRTGSHVAFPLLTDRMQSPSTHWLQGLGLCIAILPMTAIWYRTFELAVESFKERETSLGIVDVPVWPARALIVVGLLLLILELLRSALGQFARARLQATDDEEGTSGC